MMHYLKPGLFAAENDDSILEYAADAHSILECRCWAHGVLDTIPSIIFRRDSLMIT